MKNNFKKLTFRTEYIHSDEGLQSKTISFLKLVKDAKAKTAAGSDNGMWQRKLKVNSILAM